jgi:ABC-type lipoprotein release transport system permease subunit
MLMKMALRNLGRNRRRTVITLVSIAFGLMLALIFTGIGDSQYAKLIDGAAGLGWGHIAVMPPEYIDFPSLNKSLTSADTVLETVRNDPDITHAVARIVGEGMLSTARESVGIGFTAIDPAAESPETLLILENMSDGELFAADDHTGVVVGRKTADSLGVRIGDRVVFTCTDRNGEIVSSLGWVRGIYQTGSDQVDRFLVLLPMQKIQPLVGFEPNEVTFVAGICRNVWRVSTAQSRLEQQDRLAEYEVNPWNLTAPDMAGIISLDRLFNYLFQVIVFLLVAAGILNTILMSVLERNREFGVMIALGMSPGRLFCLVITEALWLSGFGILSGLIITAPLHHWLHTSGWDISSMIGKTDIAGVIYDPLIYSDLRLISLLVIMAAAFVIIILAGIYPAWRAGRTVPVESLKHIG